MGSDWNRFDPKQVRGQTAVPLGPIVVSVDAFEGVLTLRFKLSYDGSEIAKPLRVRIVGGDNDGEIVDLRLPVETDEPF